MRILFALFFAISISLTATANSANSLKAKADSAYQAQDFPLACALYEALVEESPSADAYYNMGNAFYRQKKVGKAILAYERALWLSPDHEDAHHNLEILRSNLPDRFASKRTSFISQKLAQLIESRSVETWVAWSLLWAVLTLALALLYRIATRVMLRKIGFFGALATLTLFLLATLFAFIQRNAFHHNPRAVIITTSAESYSSPTENSNKSRLLHEGTTISLIERSGKNWLQVELPDGSTTWLKKESIEEVITNF